jgi:hypothetical protein
LCILIPGCRSAAIDHLRPEMIIPPIDARFKPLQASPRSILRVTRSGVHSPPHFRYSIEFPCSI